MKTPEKFVSLHSHSGFSTYDGLSNPTEHIDFVIENGMDAWSLTDHGHMNGYPHAHQKEKELKGKGVKFKFIPGVEAYYHPNIAEWRVTKARQEELKKEEKKRAKDEDEGGEEAGTTLENEEATKDVSKWANPVNRRHHMVLLPKSRKGLQNLFKLVSRSHHEGNFYRFPRIDQKMLKECGEDLIVSSACIGGFWAYDTLTQFPGVPFDDLQPQLLDDPNKMAAVMRQIENTFDQIADAVGRENVYAELQFNKLAPQHLVNRALLEFSKKSGVQLVATVDSHYCRPEFWKEREIYKKLGRLNFEQINPDLLPKDINQLKCELYPKNAQQMWKSYGEYCAGYDFYDDQLVADAIERTWHIAHDLIGDVQPDTSMKLPSFIIPPGMSAFEALVEFSKEGLRQKQLHTSAKYVERLKHELKVIKEMNFASYFLTTKSILDIAHSQQLVGAGRGSGAGSLVCYVLGITQIDPIKYGLLFERFISRSRKDYPDVDNDLADRDLLMDAMRDKFGTENVIPISNFNTLQLKSLVKDISRLYALPFDEVNAVTGRLDRDVKPHAMQEGENKSIFQLKYDDCLKYSPTFKEFIDKYPQVGESIKVLYKQNKALGRHAGGVLVTENAEAYMPLIASKGELQTPWTEGMHYKHLEKYGFVKFDLLGLETLRMIQRAIELILVRHEDYQGHPSWEAVKAWYDKNLHPEVMDTADPKVFKYVFHEARFAGIFQFTAKHTQRFITKFHPESVDDLAVATSIYRPGPLAGKVDRLYIEAKQNPQNVKHDHPAIEKVLGPTYGYIIFQEQMMAVAHELAGMSLDDCDRLRKAIVKRSVSGQAGQKSETQVLEEMFIEGSVKNGYPRDKAAKLYDNMRAWASYGFNKSHAVAYAFCSYQCAWLMTYFEPEWLCAYMETMIGDPESRATAISEIKALDYKVGKVDINFSGYNWEIGKGKQLIPSFRTIKGVGDAAIQEIIENRPYNSLESMLWNDEGKWRHSKFNRRAFENLIKVGAFDSMKLVGGKGPFENYRQMYAVIVERQPELKKKHGQELLPQMLRDVKGEEDWSNIEKIEFQKEIVGDINVDIVVTPDIQDKLNKKGVVSIDDHPGGKKIVWMVIVDAKPMVTKANKRPYLMLFAIGPSGQRHKIFMWGASATTQLEFNVPYLVEVDKGEFVSTRVGKVKRFKGE